MIVAICSICCWLNGCGGQHAEQCSVLEPEIDRPRRMTVRMTFAKLAVGLIVGGVLLVVELAKGWPVAQHVEQR